MTDRTARAVVGAAMAAHLGHQWWYRQWTIDDAAISYAYARNVVDGWGLVPFPGGERRSLDAPLHTVLL